MERGLTGQDLINYIQANKLEDALITVTATMYYNGDHDCRTTDELSLMTGSKYDHDKKKYVDTLDIYIDSNLY